MTESNKLYFISSSDDKLKIDKEDILKVSDFIESFVEDNEENEIPMTNFSTETIKILQDFLSYINTTKFEYDINQLTVNYFLEEFNDPNSNNYKIINKFIYEFDLEKSKFFFELARYLNIKFLQECLIKQIIKKYIANHLEINKKINKTTEYLEDKIELMKLNLKEYEKENDLNEIEETYSSDEDDEDYEHVDKKIKFESNIDENVINIINQYENNIDKDGKQIKEFKKKIIQTKKHKYDEYQNYINKLDELKNDFNNRLNQSNTELQNKIDDIISISQNVFFEENTHLCKHCYKLWFVTDLYKQYDYIDNSLECETCKEEGYLYKIEEVQHDLQYLLIRKNFKPEDREDIETFDVPELDGDIESLNDIYNDLISEHSSFNFLENKCIKCHFDNLTLIQCNDHYDHFHQINRLCCKKFYCQEHFEDNGYLKCENCDKKAYICDYCCSDLRKLKDNSYQRNNPYCKHCNDFYCKECMCGHYCKQCSWRYENDHDY